MLAGATSPLASQASAPPDPAVQPVLPVLQWFVALSAAPAVPPTAVDARVYVALRSGAIAAHRMSNGARLWAVDLATQHPLAADDARVFVVSGEAVHALEGTSGQEAWRAAVGSITAPILVHAGWVIAAAADGLSAVRAADGSRVWRQDLGRIEQRPAIDGDVLFAALADGRIVALDLHTGESLWERKLPAPAGEPFVVGDRVYVGSGDKQFNALDRADGEIEWRWRVGAEVRGRAAADEDRVYFAALDNELRALDRGSGALEWHRGVPFRPTAGPIVLDGSVAIPGPVAEFRVFDAASGQALTGLRFTEPIVMTPALLAAGALGQLRIAAVTGGLNNEWRLTAFGPPGDAPDAPPVVPLTAPPGVLRPIGP